MSRRAYRKGQLMGLGILLVWFAAGVTATLYWKVLPGGWKVALTLVAGLMVPGLGDVKKLFRTYERYLTDWLAPQGSAPDTSRRPV